MIGSRNREQVRGTGIYGRRTDSDDYYYGEHTECELCERERQCFDHFGVVACGTCESDLLPARGFL